MKKIFMIAMAAATMVGCGNATKFTITGSLEAEDGKLVYIATEEGRELNYIDSVAVAANTYAFEGTAEAPYSAYLVTKEGEEARPKMVAQLYVEPGNIEVKKLNEEHPTANAVGTPLNDKKADLFVKQWELQ
jgi:hypothetical protein